MDEFEQREGESLFAYARRRLNLPKHHPAHLPPVLLKEFIEAAIEQVERQQQANIAALRDAGISGNDLLI